MGKGQLRAPDVLEHGEIIVFEAGESAVDIAAVEDAEFVIGSAVPHPHDLVLGYYSVHTSAQALQAGETHIRTIRDGLRPLRPASDRQSLERGNRGHDAP